MYPCDLAASPFKSMITIIIMVDVIPGRCLWQRWVGLGCGLILLGSAGWMKLVSCCLELVWISLFFLFFLETIWAYHLLGVGCLAHVLNCLFCRPCYACAFAFALLCFALLLLYFPLLSIDFAFLRFLASHSLARSLTRVLTRVLVYSLSHYLRFHLWFSQEWKACVCVLVQGAAWQFKGWEWDQPVTLFQHGQSEPFRYLNNFIDYSTATKTLVSRARLDSCLGEACTEYDYFYCHHSEHVSEIFRAYVL